MQFHCTQCRQMIQNLTQISSCCASTQCMDCLGANQNQTYCLCCSFNSAAIIDDKIFIGKLKIIAQQMNQCDKCNRCEKILNDIIYDCENCQIQQICQDCFDQIHSIGKFKLHQSKSYLNQNNLIKNPLFTQDFQNYSEYWQEQCYYIQNKILNQEQNIQEMKLKRNSIQIWMEQQFQKINDSLNTLRIKYEQKILNHFNEQEQYLQDRITSFRALLFKSQIISKICLNGYPECEQFLQLLQKNHLSQDPLDFQNITLNCEFESIINSIKVCEKQITEQMNISIIKTPQNVSPIIHTKNNDPKKNGLQFFLIRIDKGPIYRGTTPKVNKNLFGQKNQWTTLQKNLLNDSDIQMKQSDNLANRLKPSNQSEIIGNQKENLESTTHINRKLSNSTCIEKYFQSIKVDDKLSIVSQPRGQSRNKSNIRTQQSRKRSPSKSYGDLSSAQTSQNNLIKHQEPPQIEQYQTFDKILAHSHSLFVKSQNIKQCKVSWLPRKEPLHEFQYKLLCGIGHKVNGVEQFRQVYEGFEPSHTLLNLQPQTTYKLKLQIMRKKSTSQFESSCIYQAKQIQEGRQIKPETSIFDSVQTTIFSSQSSDLQEFETSEIISVQTASLQTIPEEQNCQIYQVIRKGNEQTIVFDKPGFIIAKNPYYFGVVTWDIKINLSSHSLSEDVSSCILIGITQKNTKTFKLIGCTINYGLSRESFKVKILLDMNKNQMIINSPQQPQGEIFNNLPTGPLYPAFYNKSNSKNSLSGLRLIAVFD